MRLPIGQARFRGVYEHFYETNRFERPGYGTHYVVLASDLTLSVEPASLPAERHGECLWMTEADLLVSPEVHENTKAYFRRKD